MFIISGHHTAATWPTVQVVEHVSFLKLPSLNRKGEYSLKITNYFDGKQKDIFVIFDLINFWQARIQHKSYFAILYLKFKVFFYKPFHNFYSYTSSNKTLLFSLNSGHI